MGNPRRRDDIMERTIGEERMLYDSAGRKIHVLNETAQFVWQCCDGEHSVDDMVQKATATFVDAAEPEVRRGIAACLGIFEKLDLLVV